MKKKSTSYRHKNNLLGKFYLSMLIVIGMGFVLFYYFGKKESLTSLTTYLSSYIDNASKTQHLAKNSLIKQKTMANNLGDRPEIHFEFYETLPNMKMEIAKSEEKINNIKPMLKKSISIANAEELERELSKHMTQIKSESKKKRSET